MKSHNISILMVMVVFSFIIFTVNASDVKSKDTHHSEHEPQEFDHDPHKDDKDYDEDVLTGTHHHQKMSPKESKDTIDTLFKEIDVNNNGKIEKSELINHLIRSMKKLHNESTHEEFKDADKNNDKKISLDEYFIYQHGDPVALLENYTSIDNSTEAKDMKKRMEHDKERFKVADNDNDGYLDVTEYQYFKYPVFHPHMAHTVIHDYIDDLDQNDDGLVDLKEYLDHFHVTDNKNQTEAEKALAKSKADFAKYDKDNNGKIDPEEYYAILKPGYEEPAQAEYEHLMKETDKNNDGLLTLAEVEKHRDLWLNTDPLDEDDDDDDDDDDYGHHFDDEL